ncbi:MAG: 16S rRNA (adenine(1518)-N(6)/adenine(1519)-N(6))-dimethyltransferase RsmA [Candidatus Harrisonbacteria bacterium]|nr:16S rRNA (adenine(1518)-N(6)/adenine(1519)-N(6))-dimethyltransferase RsmA [Candidatus Harrisonbacteria bacterium]
MEKLGQHFLINEDIAHDIVDALDIQSGELIIEIGPGKGALTELLVEKTQKAEGHFLAIEKDRRLGLKLYQRYKGLEHVEMRAGDILEELKAFSDEQGPYRLIGNLPYYLSGKILRSISELEHKPMQSVFMFQKEVAERLSAQPPKMNLLAAAVQIWAEAKLLFSLGPENFSPPPQVGSALVSLELKEGEGSDQKLYFSFIRKAFKQPRKLLLNNLREGENISREVLRELLEKYGLGENTRAQELSIELIRKLAQEYSALLA